MRNNHILCTSFSFCIQNATGTQPWNQRTKGRSACGIFYVLINKGVLNHAEVTCDDWRGGLRHGPGFLLPAPGRIRGRSGNR